MSDVMSSSRCGYTDLQPAETVSDPILVGFYIMYVFLVD